MRTGRSPTVGHAGAIPEEDEVHVWQAGACPLRDDAQVAAILDAREMERYCRFHRPQDARRFAVAHIVLRSVLALYLGTEPGSLEFEYGPYGKPHLSNTINTDLRFNMAHSHGIVLIAVACGREVGVDVERIDTSYPFMDTARSFFSEKEYALLRSAPADQRPETFFRLWTRKEAMLKATGDGIGGMGPSLDLSVGSDFFRQGKTWHVTDLDLTPGYAAVLAVESPACAVRLREWRH